MNAPELTRKGAQWRTASYTTGNNNCVEVASNLPGIAAIRDSKNPAGPALVFASEVFATFVSKVKAC